MRKLLKLQLTQFKRSTSKMEVFGRVYILVCIWAFELVGILELKSSMGELPSLHGAARPLVLAGICLSLGIADVIFKLIFKHDATVMDPFLKTKPVPDSLWENYLVASQFWHPDNLMMPLLVLPICFGIFHFGWGLIAFVVIYLLSVAGGIFLMEAKRGSNYDEGRKSGKIQVRKSLGHNNVFGMQVLSFIRSPRLRTAVIFLVGLFSIYIITMPKDMVALFVFIVMLTAPMVIGQYGFGIEANCFNAIWTKPLPVSKVLRDKYFFLGELTILVAVILAVVCLICKISLLLIFGCYIFIAGTANLLILIDACHATRFDLFGKAFFNYQGSASTYRPIMFFVIFLTMGLGGVPIFVFDGWVRFAVLAGMGLLGFALHRPIFRWEENKFLKNRYKYMEKYSK